MDTYDECIMINHVKNRIVELFAPEKIMLFNRKTNLKGATSSFKLCVIVPSDDRYEIEKNIYLRVDCDIPFDVVVYTSNEWRELLDIDTSFAHRVAETGYVIYG